MKLLLDQKIIAVEWRDRSRKVFDNDLSEWKERIANTNNEHTINTVVNSTIFNLPQMNQTIFI